MIKIVFSVFSIIIGCLALFFWAAGSHGSLFRFRPWMTEDWVLSLLILTSFGMPIVFFIKWVRKKI
jgi:hypothetical protein